MKATVACLLAAAWSGVASAEPQRIAGESESVVAMAADGERVYWATRYAVRSAPAAGGEPVEIATLPEEGAGIAELLLAGGRVVWATDRAIWAAPKAGGKARRLAAPRRALVRGIASDGERLVWVQHPEARGPDDARWTRGGAVVGMRLATGRTWSVARNVSAPIAVAVVGGFAYWPSGTTVYRAPIGGGRAAAVGKALPGAPPAGPGARGELDKPVAPRRIVALVADAQWVTWQLDGIERAPAAGGVAQPVAGLAYLGGAADDGFYQGRGRDLVRIPRGGGDPVVVAAGVGEIGAVAVAPGAVYVATQGAIVRVAR